VKKYEFVEQLKASYPVARLCRIFGVSPRLPERLLGMAPTRALRARERQRATEGADCEHSHGESGDLRRPAHPGGTRRTRGALRAQARGAAHATGGCRLKDPGCHRRRRFATTQRDPARACAPDLVKRAFVASSPDELWVADITYVPTGQGFLFLAVVLDACSRRVVGWSMATHVRAELVLGALEMALQHRRPAAGVTHHSDHGSQYTSQVFQDRCRTAGIRSSMGSVGDCYDNAMAESFFATLECELLARSSLRTHDEARAALFDFIEVFYNRRRRHSALGYLSPDAFENRRCSEILVVA